MIDDTSPQLEFQTDLQRRANTLRILNYGWLIMGLLALAQFPFYPEYRLLLTIIIAITFTTFAGVSILRRLNHVRIAGTLFSIIVNFAFLVFFFTTIQQTSVEAAFSEQVTILMMMGLAIISGGSLINKWAAIAFAFADSAILIGLMTYYNIMDNPRFSIHVFWWMLAVAIWLYENYLSEAFDRLKDHRVNLEERVAERTIELQTAYDQVRDLIQAKDDFISNVTHELRSPLTSLKLQHKMLDHHSVPAQTKHIATSRRETDRLESLVESLLLLSRLDQDRVEFQFSQIDLNQLVTIYTQDRALLAQEHDLRLAVETCKEKATVWADSSMVGQVLSILLTNAFNYTPPGGLVKVETEILLNGTHHWAILKVIDNGPGIPPAEQAELFERFFRGKAATERKVSGTGLGLAIAHKIVDRHKGRIEVESSGIPGEGATFSTYLPLQTTSPISRSA